MAQTVVVSRSGSVRIKRATIDAVKLNWEGGDQSKPKTLSAGLHIFRCYVRGEKGATWAFWFDEPQGTPCSPSGVLDGDGWDEADCILVIG